MPAQGSIPAWQLTNDASHATITTAKLKVRVDLATGAINFSDASGKPILAEKDAGRSIAPAEVQGEKDAPRTAAMGAGARRVAVRTGRKPTRTTGHQGLRSGPMATQRDRCCTVAGFQPRLRHFLGQHFVHALRGSSPF